jgi:hypothetical protein
MRRRNRYEVVRVQTTEIPADATSTALQSCSGATTDEVVSESL